MVRHDKCEWHDKWSGMNLQSNGDERPLRATKLPVIAALVGGLLIGAGGMAAGWGVSSSTSTGADADAAAACAALSRITDEEFGSDLGVVSRFQGAYALAFAAAHAEWSFESLNEKFKEANRYVSRNDLDDPEALEAIAAARQACEDL